MTTTETPTAELRIKRALGRMPYLPLTRDYYSTSADPESLARTLENFADTLSRIAEDNQKDFDRLKQLEFDLAAVRRIFGREV